MRTFRQVDVFSSEPLMGNPVAVVHDADALSDTQMAAFARWTNLSETTFLLTPTDRAADYRVRIFTPGGELPFAGHPTLGTAHAWLEEGGVPRGERIMQECGLGLVQLLREDQRLAFGAPEPLRWGPVSEEDLQRIAAGLEIRRDEIVDAHWTDNGPGWVSVLLADASAVLAVRPDPVRLGDFAVGVVGIYPEGECAIEVRAFVGGLGVDEDPVTGSLNAGVAQWLTANGTLPSSYVSSQGTALGRRGRVHVTTDADGVIWVGGDTRTTVLGSVTF
ncbi:PhzF family phenazine biosynthesis protein [Nocardioides sp. CER19]|uniref:PhzF family phenazine biosynthesis protein n=1 Tax=Nocardioides sp. CER19 TaxID=3038538 RepID=UPI002448A6DE|nr:PhzF family phenazine biosynthesis protein [Nocardioides sp. CER19]MDH2415891.1 PhzF family phenazine biosynthesis protein [Nocardioides sp. CER19]